jgi:hypothetical protein
MIRPANAVIAAAAAAIAYEVNRRSRRPADAIVLDVVTEALAACDPSPDLNDLHPDVVAPVVLDLDEKAEWAAITREYAEGQS